MVHPERVEKHILEDEKESRAYIDQLWAEMMELYRNTKFHKLKLSKEIEEYLKDMQKEFMPEDTKVGIIQAWLDQCFETHVCSMMLYKEALGHDNEEPKQWELREINDIMNNSIEGWNSDKQHRFDKYGQQRSWKRIGCKDGFIPLSDKAELPFD